MSQHDETRKILEIIRENKRTKITSNKRLIIEQEEVVEEKELDPAEYTEEERKFRDTVSPRVQFNKFKLYPKAQNVEFSGKFTDTRIEWYYSLDDSRGVYITGDMAQLSDETLKQIQKLVGYYQTWSDEWANRIAEEYQSEKADEENEGVGPESIASPGMEGFEEEEFQTPEGNV
tara:strand:- start:264 stop:788 length:525 start_codon:yes stop_codon:yes gene_type:complete